MLFLAGASAQFAKQSRRAAPFDGMNHVVHGVGGTGMPVGGAHIVHRVGEIDHGSCHVSIAVEFGGGAENGGKLR